MSLDANAFPGRGRKQAEQSSDCGVATICCDESRGPHALAFGVNRPAVLDRGNGATFTNLRATFASSIQKELIKDATFDGDLASSEIRQRITQHPPVKPDEFNYAEARVREFEETFAHVQSIENWAAPWIQAIAAELFSRKHAAFDEDRRASRLRTRRCTCRTRRTRADDSDIVNHHTKTSAMVSAIIRPRGVRTTRPSRSWRNPSSRNSRSSFCQGAVSRNARPSPMRI